MSPPLRWSSVPAGARDLLLVVEDPDAGGFVHWTVAGIAPRLRAIAAGRPPAGAVQTKNGFGKRGWGGPCPPKGKGPHRYVFALYALRARSGIGSGSSPDQVRSALAKGALARGSLTARYER